MHNQGVKKQLFLLFQVFNKIKKGESIMADKEKTKETQEPDDENSDDISVDIDKEVVK